MILCIFCSRKERKFIKTLSKNCGLSAGKLVIEAVKYFYENKLKTNKS